MPYENKPREGALFKNKEKVADTDPDYKGSYKHEDGTEHGLNAWINTSKNGVKYMKISSWSKAETAEKGLADARASMAPAPAPEPAPQPKEEFSDDIPF